MNPCESSLEITDIFKGTLHFQFFRINTNYVYINYEWCENIKMIDHILKPPGLKRSWSDYIYLICWSHHFEARRSWSLMLLGASCLFNLIIMIIQCKQAYNFRTETYLYFLNTNHLLSDQICVRWRWPNSV